MDFSSTKELLNFSQARINHKENRQFFLKKKKKKHTAQLMQYQQNITIKFVMSQKIESKANTI